MLAVRFGLILPPPEAATAAISAIALQNYLHALLLQCMEVEMSTVALSEVAGGQWGLVTTAQAGGVGVSPQTLARLVRAGALERLAHGAYRLTGTPSTPYDDLRAAWLLLDPRRTAGERFADEAPAVVSHRSAAWVRELGDLDADRHEFTVARRKQSRRSDLSFHRGDLAVEDWSLVDGLPVTTAARTVVDLASSRLDGGHLGGVVRDALVSQQADADQVVELLRPFAHYYGVPLGDGQALVEQFLAEAGVPETAVRTVELADPARPRAGNRSWVGSGMAQTFAASDLSRQIAQTLATTLTNSPQYQQLTARLNEQIRQAILDSPAFRRTLAQAGGLQTNPAIAKQVKELALAAANTYQEQQRHQDQQDQEALDGEDVEAQQAQDDQ